jgi:hypothetical protein
MLLSHYNSVLVSHNSEASDPHKGLFSFTGAGIIIGGTERNSRIQFYFQLLHNVYFCAPTCFGYLLWPSSGSYNIIKT